MGDRAQVHIKDKNVYLYTHWNGTDLVDVVRSALKRGRERWSDPEYLARIIFNEMTSGQEKETAGYGIGTAVHGDIWRLVTVDCQKQTVTVNDHADEYLNSTLEIPFQEFIQEIAA